MWLTNGVRLLASIIFATVSACNEAAPFDGATLFIEGTISSREPIWPSTPTFVVVDSARIADYCDHAAIVTFGADLIVLQNGVRKDTSDLTVGRYVSVYTSGVYLKTCAPIVSGVGVLLR